MMRLTYPFFFLFAVLLFAGCGPDGVDDDGPVLPSFDRRGMLTEWADEVVIPNLTNLETQLSALVAAQDTFARAANSTNLAALRESFTQAYLSWQRLSPLVIGKAEEIRLREQLNTYPADVVKIEANALAATPANLELPSNTAAQGFPAVEYLLYGLEEGALTTGPQHLAYQAYLTQLVNRMAALTTTALADWNNGYRDVFIQNDGNSATASIDRTVNDYIFYYEKFLRAGKVGIPAGIFSDDPLPDRAESLYAGNSLPLFLEALASSRDFFADRGLARYLDALDVRRDGELLSARIIRQFEVVRTTTAGLDSSFADQVTNDNQRMLALYDEMQKLVVLLKVDMLQALSINVDYVDADGD